MQLVVHLPLPNEENFDTTLHENWSDMIRDLLIQATKEAKAKDEGLARELRAMITRRYPDRETYETLEQIFDIPQPMKQSKVKEIVLTSADFQKKTILPMTTVVDRGVKKEVEKPNELNEVKPKAEDNTEDFVGGMLEDKGETDDEIVEAYGGLPKLRKAVNLLLRETGREELFKNTTKQKVCDTYRELMSE